MEMLDDFVTNLIEKKLHEQLSCSWRAYYYDISPVMLIFLLSGQRIEDAAC